MTHTGILVTVQVTPLSNLSRTLVAIDARLHLEQTTTAGDMTTWGSYVFDAGTMQGGLLVGKSGSLNAL